MKTLLAMLLATTLGATAAETVTVFRGGDGGYGGIRIPALVTAKDGTVLAFAEGRETLRDQAGNDIVLRRSADGGKTWQPLQKLADFGKDSLNNPCPVVDAKTGRITLFFQRYPASVHEYGKMDAGCATSNTVRNLVMTSDDAGSTWSAPRDNTCEVKRPAVVTTIASGPGFGIQLQRGPKAGRLLIPFNEGPKGAWRVYTAFSDDGGATWRHGDVPAGCLTTNAQRKVESHVNEVQIAELADGSVLLNTRSQTGPRVRRQTVSRDGGETWDPVRQVPELHDDPCMASILGLNAGKTLLFSGPTRKGRFDGVLFSSADGGTTWQRGAALHTGPFAYSCLTELADGQIGCLYETGEKGCYERIDFARFTMSWARTP